MSMYTLDHMVAELVSERSDPSSQARAPRGSDFYYASWEALNRWLESRLKNRVGGNVTPLGNFTWEFRDASDGTKQCRPIFLLGDSFRKDHHVRGNKFHPPTLAPSEEANFSLMAIKFSKSLTKDMLFAGVRDIIKKIGDYVDRIYEIEVEFSFGVLRSQERRVTFEFDNARLRQILPRVMAAELEEKELGYTQETNQFNKDYHHDVVDSSVDLSLSNAMNSTSANNYAEPKGSSFDASTLPPLNLNHQTSPEDSKYSDRSYSMRESSPATQSDTGSDKKPFQMPKLIYNGTYKDVDPHAVPPPVSPGLQRVLEGYDKELFSHEARVSRRIKACEEVAQQAFDRCLNHIENETATNDYIDYQDRMLQNDWNSYSSEERKKRQEEVDSISQTVKQQMQVESDKKRADKLERKMTKIPLGLPGQVVAPEESRESIKKRQAEIRAELRHTIERERDSKMQLKKTLDMEEKGKLAIISKEVDVDAIKQRKNNLSKQRDLLDAWEREAHVRNLQKIQKKRGNLEHVQTYISETNLRDDGGASGSGTFRMGSVGFDSRRK